MGKQNKKTVGAGRRAKRDGPALPRDEVDRLLVHGEAAALADGKGATVRYPSYRELAERYGVAPSLVAKYSKEHNCLGRRKQAKKRAQELADEKLAELRAEDLAVSRDDAVRIIDRFVLQFDEALKEERVRCDNPADLNTMLRLKALLLGDADSRQETLGGLTLEDVQQRHKAMLENWDASTPEMRGEAPLRAVPNEDSDEDSATTPEES